MCRATPPAVPRPPSFRTFLTSAIEVSLRPAARPLQAGETPVLLLPVAAAAHPDDFGVLGRRRVQPAVPPGALEPEAVAGAQLEVLVLVEPDLDRPGQDVHQLFAVVHVGSRVARPGRRPEQHRLEPARRRREQFDVHARVRLQHLPVGGPQPPARLPGQVEQLQHRRAVGGRQPLQRGHRRRRQRSLHGAQETGARCPPGGPLPRSPARTGAATRAACVRAPAARSAPPRPRRPGPGASLIAGRFSCRTSRRYLMRLSSASDSGV